MEKEVTIYDIAKILNLSAATVSRALNDHPAINIKTRLAISAKATELGYRSNTFASNLRKKSTHTLGVVVPRLNSNFMSSVLAGMETVANQAGYNLLISQSLESFENEKANMRTMYNSRVDGLMVSVAYDTHSYDHFESFQKRRIPVLFFDRTIEREGFLGIVIDNQEAGYQVTKHLIAQGCKRIMHVGGNLARNVYSGRLQGYQQALSEAGIEFDPSLYIINDLSSEAGADVGELISKMPDRPDGLFIANDICAVSCMKSLIKKGFNIPNDIAVAGFNNDFVSEIIEPNLTTINYPGRQMGELAVTTLIDHLAGRQVIDVTNKIILTSQLVVRGSSVRG